MKILIVSHYFPPLNASASLRPYSWAKWWSRFGHDVTVLTSSKASGDAGLVLPMEGFRVIQTQDSFYDRLGRRLRRSEPTEGRVSGNGAAPPSWLKRLSRKTGMLGGDCRLPNAFAFWWRDALNHVAGERWDLVVSSFAPYASHQVAYHLRRAGAAQRWIADFRDPWSDTELYPGLFPFTLAERYIERKFLRRADLATAITEPLAAVLRAKGYARRVEVVENGFDPENVSNLEPRPYWPSGECVRIVYTGAIYEGERDPSPLLAAIAELRDANDSLLRRLRVVFACTDSANLSRLVERHGVGAWVDVMAFQPRADAWRMQRDADVLLFLDREAPGSNTWLPAKIYEYLWSGTYVWGIGISKASAPGRLIEEAGVGRCMGSDVTAIRVALRELLAAGRKPKVDLRQDVRERYDRRVLADRMLQLAVSA